MIGGEARTDGEYLFRGQDDGFAFAQVPPEDRDAVIDELVALRRQGWGLTNSSRHLRDFGDFLATGRSAWTCASGAFALDVRPDGSVSACKEKPPLGHILDPAFARFYRSGEFGRQAAAQAAACSGCFYGEYREPAYAIRDSAVLREWMVDWLRTFRKGMAWQRRASFRSRPFGSAGFDDEAVGRHD